MDAAKVTLDAVLRCEKTGGGYVENVVRDEKNIVQCVPDVEATLIPPVASEALLLSSEAPVFSSEAPPFSSEAPPFFSEAPPFFGETPRLSGETAPLSGEATPFPREVTVFSGLASA